jgi:flagellar export protein FliJ
VFVFKLQQVLEHRKNIEEIALKEFSDALLKLNAERITMMSLIEKGKLLTRQWKALVEQPTKIADVSVHAEYIQCVQQSLRDQVVVVTTAETETQTKREALLSVVKERKILETLKEKRRLAYEADLASQERKTLDEVALLKFKGERS